MPARIIYSWAEIVNSIIYNIDEIFISVLKTGVFCLYTIWAGMDVLQSFFGGRLLSAHIRPFSLISRIKNILSGKKRAGAEVLSSGEEKLSAVRPFVSISGWVRMSSISSGEELMTPASPVIFVTADTHRFTQMSLRVKRSNLFVGIATGFALAMTTLLSFVVSVFAGGYGCSPKNSSGEDILAGSVPSALFTNTRPNTSGQLHKIK